MTTTGIANDKTAIFQFPPVGIIAEIAWSHLCRNLCRECSKPHMLLECQFYLYHSSTDISVSGFGGNIAISPRSFLQSPGHKLLILRALCDRKSQICRRNFHLNVVVPFPISAVTIAMSGIDRINRLQTASSSSPWSKTLYRFDIIFPEISCFYEHFALSGYRLLWHIQFEDTQVLRVRTSDLLLMEFR